MICKSGAPTLDGSNTSSSEVECSSILQTTRYWMSIREKMRKVKPLRLQPEMVTTATTKTKDGRSSILTRLRNSEPRASTRSLDSTSTDHSTSDQECQCKELLSATVPTTSGSRDGERTSELSNGTSMKFQRPSRTTTGSLTHLTSKEMEDHPISDALLPTQDGGSYSDTKEATLSTREERLLKLRTKT
jgi:hypothetical protein